MKHLAHALHANGDTPPGKRTERLAFNVAVLGVNQTRLSPDDSFANRPQGTWIVTKIFVGEEEGEVFLNLDPRHGVGEFSFKDEDYAETVMRELGSVL